MNKVRIHIAVWFSLLFLLFSCIEKKCTGVEEVYVSDYLLRKAKEKKIEYCNLVKKSIEQDGSSIKEISLLQFYDGASYEHGAVLIDIIDGIGEENYIKHIQGLKPNEKSIIETYISAGLHLEPQRKRHNNSYEIKEAFPKLHLYLTEK